MHRTVKIALEAIPLIAFAAIAGWVFLRALKRSEDPARLIFKWTLTALVLGFMIWKAAPMADPNTYGVAAYDGILLTAISAMVLAVIWRHGIASIVAKPFGSLYDGGDREAEPRPLYSIAQARQKRGNYAEAVALIRQQLDKFPTDFDGQLMLATIQARDLNDLPGAEITVGRLCRQPGHAPGNIALALNTLADWQLKFAQDREAAKRALERIIALFPETELEALAAQRIAHLADTAFLIEAHDRKRIAVAAGVKDLGLLAVEQQPKAPESDPQKQAADYVKQLEEHPLDTEAREKLAILYADYYGRLDLAADQFEQLITHPHQPARRVVHWLNLLADLQVRHSADYETVRQTLQRIINLFPDAAAAQTARNRLDHLKLEFKARQAGQTLKLGAYEQDIGLKGNLPRQL